MLHPNPNQQSVLRTLKGLRTRGYESLPTFRIDYEELPTVGHLIRDLEANGAEVQYRNGITGRDAGDIYDFIAGWDALQSDPATDVNKRQHVPFTAWGVRATDNGLLSCGFRIPQSLQCPTVFLSPVGNGHKLPAEMRKERPLFHTILTPAGTITDIHDDSPMVGTLLVVVRGKKVIFSWPGTDANRKYFKDAHGVEHFLRLPEAVSKMPDGFKLTILNPGDALAMPPGTIHAVLSPINSAISCWEYVNAEWLGDDEIQEGAEWVLGVLRSRKARLSVDLDLEYDLKGLKYGYDMWRCLLLNLQEPKHAGFQTHLIKVQKFVDWLGNEIEKLVDWLGIEDSIEIDWVVERREFEGVAAFGTSVTPKVGNDSRPVKRRKIPRKPKS
jgi:hypothetical protein